MRRLRHVLVGTAAASVTVASCLTGAPSAAADTINDGNSFTGKLLAGHRITSPNGKYRFVMQTDGNLVLRVTNGRACWSSRTNGTGSHTYAEYSNGSEIKFEQPRLKLMNQDLGGQLNIWYGTKTFTHRSGNMNVNDKGEIWIAWHKFKTC